ncbi:MAG: hypothetical protein NVSMB12_11010 [Acidimicrobiales bacterium]
MKGRRWMAWVALAIVLGVALLIGSRGTGRVTPDERSARIEGEVRCPTCAGQSALVSDAPAAKAVRTFVAQQVAAGQSDGRIEQQLKDRYGSDILLRPPASGIDGLVWFIPIVAFAAAAAGLVLAFRRWHAEAEAAPPVSEADRIRVASERGQPDRGQADREET